MATEPAPPSDPGPDVVFPADHPALPGHFPGDPLVPGVLLLGHVAAALEHSRGPVRITAIRQAKFLAPLRPREPCAIRFAAAGPGAARFECRSRGRVLATGILAFDGPRPDADARD
jgi:3-hydroxymyristoyl/3-hydroxydecanoyl-(acyl carrier protein) dehydratase